LRKYRTFVMTLSRAPAAKGVADYVKSWEVTKRTTIYKVLIEANAYLEALDTATSIESVFEYGAALSFSSDKEASLIHIDGESNVLLWKADGGCLIKVVGGTVVEQSPMYGRKTFSKTLDYNRSPIVLQAYSDINMWIKVGSDTTYKGGIHAVFTFEYED